MQVKKLEALVSKLRKDAIKSLYLSQSGHPGSSLSVMDVLVALYFGGIMKIYPRDPRNPWRDFFVLSNGHACPGWYAVLAKAGYFKPNLLDRLRGLGSPLQGHSPRGALPGAGFSSG